MGAKSVQWERTLFYGTGVRFMGAEFVSWRWILFHGGLKVQNISAMALKDYEGQFSIVKCSNDVQR